jgi:hypothetical protein
MLAWPSINWMMRMSMPSANNRQDLVEVRWSNGREQQ